MGEITVSGRIARQDPLNASPEASYRYLADNESLLKRFLGPDRVTVLSAGQYRIQMKRFRILGFSFKPGFIVAFAQTPPDRITMQSVNCQLSEQSHPDLNVDATFWGAAQFMPDGSQCILKSEVEAHVRLSLPGALAWLPASLVQPVANGLLQATLEALSLRLIPMMRSDLARTLKKQPSPLSVKEETVS